MAKGESRWFCAGLVLFGPHSTKVLVIDYTRLGRTEIKFPGGSEKSGNGRNDRGPQDTLSQEFSEEVFKDSSGRILMTGTSVFDEEVSDNHTKFLFHCAIEGEFREGGLVDQQDGKPDELLSPPYWIEATDLLRSSNFARWHRKAFEFAITDYLVNLYPEWVWVAREMHLI